jgi:hypothetical protein
MKYILLIYGNEAEGAKRSQEQMGAMLEEYGVFTESIRHNGNYVAGERLQSSATATTVRVREGKTLPTDGPFAETKEHLGGFYLIEAKDLDEATAIAARIPSARFGCVEVRPIHAM